MLVAWILGANDNTGAAQTVLWLGITIGFLMVIPNTYFLQQQYNLAAEIERNMDNLHDMSVVADLCHMLHTASHDIAVRTLTVLLPRMDHTQVQLINFQQRKMLYDMLTSNRRGEDQLILSILAVLQRIGDSKAIPYVQKLANGELRARRNRAILEAAQSCLPVLFSISKQNDSQLSLLRPANAWEESPHHLLHPEISGNDSTHLLRSSERTLKTNGRCSEDRKDDGE